MGAMIEKCNHCHALFWKEEVNFMNCCKRGEIVLLPLSESPDLLKRLLTYDYLDSNSFFQHIRQYNSALAFTFIVYTPDRRLGVHAYNPIFQIQGELYHLQGPLNPQAGNDLMYAQYFIYDLNEATRLRSAHNTNLS
jgi:hypothetical protein